MVDSPDKKPTPSSGPGRFTPKGAKAVADGAKGVAKSAGAAGDAAKKAAEDNLPSYAKSRRYTAPAAPSSVEVEALKPTPFWVPYLMFFLLVLGGLLIILNYVGFLPDSPSQWYLIGGIVSITLGFITATQLR